MNIDWKNGPQLAEVKSLEITPPVISYLSNGIKVIKVSGGTQPVTKIDLVFKGGRFLESKKLTSRFTSALIREGSKKYPHELLSETLDYYGVNIRSASNLDFNYLSFSCLNRHMPKVLPIIGDLLSNPRFEQTALDRFKNKIKSSLTLDLSKNEMICYREFTELLYGNDHAYGYNTENVLIDEVSKHDIFDFYQRAYAVDNCFIIVTGLPDNNIEELLENQFCDLPKLKSKYDWDIPYINTPGAIKNISSQNKLQNAIKIGRRVCNRNHEDYPALFFLNSILGGFFGSRLMNVIREELGYTYNIYSTIDNLRYDSYMYIASEVNTEFTQPTLDAINNVIHGLQTELISNKELMMVKNYLKGNFLSLIDGPFLQGTLLRSLEIEGFELSLFEKFYKDIQELNNDQIKDAAIKYLQPKDLLTVIVGE
jgi:predicted Zn-dependent peptidase